MNILRSLTRGLNHIKASIFTRRSNRSKMGVKVDSAIPSAYRKLVERYTTQIDKATINNLPGYENHGRRVVLVDDHNLHHAVHDLLKSRYLGFDTESRPTFKRGEKTHGISLIQLCSATCCYLFQMGKISDATPMARVINDPRIRKVGVGLRGDLSELRSGYNFQPQGIVDLAPLFKPLGRNNDAGSKQLVALALKQKLRKSKKASTSNWGNDKLTPLQVEYASDDAFSSIDIYLKIRDEFKPYVPLLDKGVAALLDLHYP